MKIVIIGSSAAGISAAETIRSKDKKSEIILISQEKAPIYSRCLLSYYLAGTIPEEKLIFRPDNFLKENNVKALLGETVSKVNPKDKTIKLASGKEIKFDRLLVATGSASHKLQVPGSNLKGVVGLRTLADAKEILARVKKIKTACILGGGLIGLKSAYGISHCVPDVRIIVKSPQLLSQMVDKQAADIFQAHIAENGIKVMTGLEAVEISGKKEVSGIKLNDGTKIDCQLVIVGKGVVPNIDLVKDTEIKTDWGILTDEHMQTNVAGIYAAGDCCQTLDLITGQSQTFGLWPLAMAQGRIAGLNITGESLSYDGSLAMNSVEFFDLPVISAGLTRPSNIPEGCEILSKGNINNKTYQKLVIKDNRLVGMILVGEIDVAGIMKSLMESKADISLIKDRLLDEYFDFAKIVPVIESNKDKFKKEEYKELIKTSYKK